MSKIELRPNEVNIKGGLMGSAFRKSEKETIACNIVKISMANAPDGMWMYFTWDEYCACCTHEPCAKEHSYLGDFVDDGYLEYDNSGRYSVTNKFLVVLFNFRKA